MSPDPAPSPTRRRGTSPLRLLLGIGVVAAVALGAWIGWLYWGSVQWAHSRADAEVADLRSRWGAEPAPTPSTDSGRVPEFVADPVVGRAEWVLTVPALGGRAWPVIVGADPASVARGVGWYPSSQQPGQVGNFAVTGLRITQAQAFSNLLSLDAGDTVVVESREAFFTYTIISAPRDLTVQADDRWVLDPVPGRDDLAPTQAFITLTSSEDLIPTDDRCVAFGVLTETKWK